jgi:hypothetical protein
MPRNAYLLGIAVKCQAIADSWMDPERLHRSRRGKKMQKAAANKPPRNKFLHSYFGKKSKCRKLQKSQHKSGLCVDFPGCPVFNLTGIL